LPDDPDDRPASAAPPAAPTRGRGAAAVTIANLSGARAPAKAIMKKILILGVNGFIGHHLSSRIIADTDWEVYGMDMQADRIADLLPEKRFHFFEGDITINKEWIEYHIKKCDTVLPLVAIATPATYVREPLRVFELDFEANLPIVRHCVRHKRRIIFPSTSEVYGMCADAEFDSETSELVLGPINKTRWIYACAKQLMDRVIHAYAMEEGLDYTLFRPFNWIGSGLDSINTAKEGSSRVTTQFLGHIVRGETIKLVDGGTQKRAYTYIDDGVSALMKIIDNEGGVATGKIYNIGNPANNFSVRELATMMLDLALTYPEYRDTARQVKIVDITSAEYYGKGYQDVQNRTPKIANTCADLEWKPTVPMDEALKRIFDAYVGQVGEARRLVE
jgi:nucleoside-diphosphate-sugar epimerase